MSELPIITMAGSVVSSDLSAEERLMLKMLLKLSGIPSDLVSVSDRPEAHGCLPPPARRVRPHRVTSTRTFRPVPVDPEWLRQVQVA